MKSSKLTREEHTRDEGDDITKDNERTPNHRRAKLLPRHTPHDQDPNTTSFRVLNAIHNPLHTFRNRPWSNISLRNRRGHNHDRLPARPLPRSRLNEL